MRRLAVVVVGGKGEGEENGERNHTETKRGEIRARDPQEQSRTVLAWQKWSTLPD
jgi:hypothetical protein